LRRYDEQRGPRKSAYVGRYCVKGDRIWYVDDTGFTADGEFRDASSTTAATGSSGSGPRDSAVPR
jgi:Agrobacterium tumefaciens protein Atu4866